MKRDGELDLYQFLTSVISPSIRMPQLWSCKPRKSYQNGW